MKIDREIISNRFFRKLWIAHSLSQLSGYSLLFLVIGRTFEITTSNIAAGMLWISFTLPTLFFSPFVGSLVDIWSKQRILMITNFLHWLIIYVFALSFSFSKHFLAYPLFFLYASISSINDPAEMAMIPKTVKSKAQLLTANNILFFTDHAALILSSVVGGILSKIASLPVAISLVAAMPLFAALVSSTLPKEKIKRVKKLSFWLELGKLITRVKVGYGFLGKNLLVLYGFLLLIMFRVLLSASTLLLPSLSKNILGASVYDAGLIVVLPLALGVIIGTVILNRNQENVRKWAWIGAGLTMLGSLLLFLILINPPNLILRRILNIVFAVMIGICIAAINAPAQSFIQEVTPPTIRGQMFSTLNFFRTIASIPLVFLATTLAEILGIKLFLIIIGIIILFSGTFIIRRGNEIILSSNHRS